MELEEGFGLPKGVLVITILCTSTKTPEWEGKTGSFFLYHRTHENTCVKKEITKHKCSGEIIKRTSPKQTAQ